MWVDLKKLEELEKAYRGNRPNVLGKEEQLKTSDPAVCVCNLAGDEVLSIQRVEADLMCVADLKCHAKLPAGLATKRERVSLTFEGRELLDDERIKVLLGNETKSSLHLQILINDAPSLPDRPAQSTWEGSEKPFNRMACWLLHVVLWFLDMSSLALGAWLTTRFWQDWVLFILLALSLWLPFTIFAVWGSVLMMERSFVGVGALLTPFLWCFLCCGVGFCLWVPLYLVMIPLQRGVQLLLHLDSWRQRGRCIHEMASVDSCCGLDEMEDSIEPESWAVYEILMLHLRAFGDLPRTILCAYILLSSGSDDVALACLVVSATSILFHICRFFRWFGEAKDHFNEVVLEQVEP